MVLGINGTNDPRELVQAFVDGLELEQPILLRGGEVALGSYAVRRYPAKFWIDREGRIVDFTTGGLEPGALQKKIDDLLR